MPLEQAWRGKLTTLISLCLRNSLQSQGRCLFSGLSGSHVDILGHLCSFIICTSFRVSVSCCIRSTGTSCNQRLSVNISTILFLQICCINSHLNRIGHFRNNWKRSFSLCNAGSLTTTAHLLLCYRRQCSNCRWSHGRQICGFNWCNGRCWRDGCCWCKGRGWCNGCKRCHCFSRFHGGHCSDFGWHSGCGRRKGSSRWKGSRWLCRSGLLWFCDHRWNSSRNGGRARLSRSTSINVHRWSHHNSSGFGGSKG
mmetsp:Transcript_24449/g.53304  ORF Transcript_24449/g.53304 Transcript_24449/m.53304 type:complete len:253 (+) Transcript_24449:1105-1863(+)